MVRAKTSRPYWSVPNHQRPDGGRSRLIGACLNGSPVIHGASTAIVTSAASSNAPMKIVGLRRIAAPRRVSGGAKTASWARADTGASIPDARVEKSVGDVYQQVDQHFHPGEYDDQSLDDRIVALKHRIHGQASETGNVEHGLGDDDARDEQRNADADDGDDRHRSVLERVQH